jgi:hypothetical protein
MRAAFPDKGSFSRALVMTLKDIACQPIASMNIRGRFCRGLLALCRQFANPHRTKRKLTREGSPIAIG